VTRRPRRALENSYATLQAKGLVYRVRFATGDEEEEALINDAK
jgi:hypothetical protein